MKLSVPFDVSFPALEEIDHSDGYDDITSNTEGNSVYDILLNRCGQLAC